MCGSLSATLYVWLIFRGFTFHLLLSLKISPSKSSLVFSLTFFFSVAQSICFRFLNQKEVFLKWGQVVFLMFFKSLFLLLLHCFLCDVMFHCRGNIAFIKKEREYKKQFVWEQSSWSRSSFLFICGWWGYFVPSPLHFFLKRERRIFLFVFKFVSVCCKYL